MDLLNAFGLFAVTAMVVCYALERKSRWFILAFAMACALGSVYGFLQGAWPFGVVEAVWTLIAVRRFAAPFPVGVDPAQSKDRMEQRIQMAERLQVITQKLGFVLWQLQELEGLAAMYFVLLAQTRQGMGTDAGQVLVEQAQKKTFGATIRALTKADLLSAELESRITSLLSERNWLVHKSRATNRRAVHDDGSMHRLLSRLDRIDDESAALMRELQRLAEHYVKLRGVSAELIQAKADALLDQWHSTDG